MKWNVQEMDRIGILLRYGSVEPKTFFLILFSFVSTLIAAFQKKYIKLFIFVIFMQNNNPLYGYFITNLFSHTHQLGISHIIHIYAASYQSLQKQLRKNKYMKNE